MLTFLNSVILTALAAALIPLLIHLFNKRRTKKIIFSSLRFLKNLEKQRLKKIRLYQLLLILIRTLIIIFLVLAFARPTVTGNWSAMKKSAARTTAVILLDDGLNMRQYDIAGNRFNRALLKLKEILNSFETEDKVNILISSSPQIDVIDSLDLEHYKGSYYIGNYTDALAQARRIFNNNLNLNKELHIISDFNTMSDSSMKQLKNFSDVVVYLEKIAQEGDGNVSVDSIIILNELLEKNKPINFGIYLRNHSPNEAKNINVHLFIDKLRVAQTNVIISPGETKSLNLSFQPMSSGKQSGYVEIEDDDLLADNRHYFSIDIPEKINFLFVDSNPSLYLKAALETINRGSNVNVTFENYNTLAIQSFLNYDVICLSNFPELSMTIINRIGSYLKAGGGLIIIPGNSTIIPSFNRNFSPVIGNIKINNQVRVTSDKSFFTLKPLDKNHPLVDGIFRDKKSKISLPHISTYFKFSKSGEYKNLILLNSGDPYLLQSVSDERNILLLSTYFDNFWSDVQFKGIYIPLLLRTIKLAASSSSPSSQRIFIGGKFVLNINNFEAQNTYDFVLPNGYISKLVPSFSNTGFFFNLNSFHEPGNYKILGKGIPLSIISVNVESKKILSVPPNLGLLTKENDHIKLINEDENIFNIVKETRLGLELWKYAIIIAILFLILETILVKKIEGRRVLQK